MRKAILVGLGAAAVMVAAGAADASACSRRARTCTNYAPPLAYQYAPAPVHAYAPPPAAYYAPPAYGYGPPPGTYGAAYYEPAAPAYGYGYRGCDRGYGYRGYGYGGYGYGYGGYGYAPPVAYDDDDYRPAGVWVPVR